MNMKSLLFECLRRAAMLNFHGSAYERGNCRSCWSREGKKDWESGGLDCLRAISSTISQWCLVLFCMYTSPVSPHTSGKLFLAVTHPFYPVTVGAPEESL